MLDSIKRFANVNIPLTATSKCSKENTKRNIFLFLFALTTVLSIPIQFNYISQLIIKSIIFAYCANSLVLVINTLEFINSIEFKNSGNISHIKSMIGKPVIRPLSLTLLLMISSIFFSSAIFEFNNVYALSVSQFIIVSFLSLKIKHRYIYSIASTLLTVLNLYLTGFTKISLINTLILFVVFSLLNFIIFKFIQRKLLILNYDICKVIIFINVIISLILSKYVLM